MTFRLLIVISISLIIPCTGSAQVWTSDQGDGTYINPILHLDYSDPDVVRVGSDFYMTASSFNCVPGLPILHSKDLVNWELINYALPKQYPEEVFSSPQHFKGVWAPCIRYHQGTFYIYYGDPDFGIYVLTSTDPAGTWSKPKLVVEGKGLIDPSPIWDDDGNVYLVHAWAASRVRVNSLLTLRRLDATGTRALDDGRHVFDGHLDHTTVEGPKFYKRNGYYYIFAPAGGVATGWQLILRSKNIYGPYEEKVVLEQGSTGINGPHQGGWVDTPTGQDWFVHFQDKEAYGRIVHLQPVQWVGDWPLMGKDLDGNGVGEPVSRHSKPDVGQSYPIRHLAASDDFSGSDFGKQWQWHANPHVVWSAKLPGTDYLRLFAMPRPADFVNHWSTPHLLLQKFPGPSFTATTELTLHPTDTGQAAGLIIMGRDYTSLQLERIGGGYALIHQSCTDADKGGAEREVSRVPVQESTVQLRVQVAAPDATCQFQYSTDGTTFRDIGPSFAARPGGWIGTKVGLYSTKSTDSGRGGFGEFAWFSVSK